MMYQILLIAFCAVIVAQGLSLEGRTDPFEDADKEMKAAGVFLLKNSCNPLNNYKRVTKADGSLTTCATYYCANAGCCDKNHTCRTRTFTSHKCGWRHFCEDKRKKFQRH